MAMKKCKECGKEVSSRASRCPHCGIKAPAGLGLIKLIFVGLFGLLIYSVASDYVMFQEKYEQRAAERSGNRTAATPSPSAPVLELTSMRCTKDTIGNAIIEGQVRNVSDRPIGHVRVIASFYTGQDEHLGTRGSYIELNPLMPRQLSGFKIYGVNNPLYRRCGIDGFEVRSRQLSWQRAAD